MCSVLKLPRSTYYYELQKPNTVKIEPFTDDVIRIFRANRKSYGTRRIKKELKNEGKILSRRRIGRIMKTNGLVSVYTVANYKVHKSTCNNDKINNVVDRKFDNRDVLEVVVSDLTYVRVNGKWNYVCLITDLHIREFIGYSAVPYKTADLVHKAFSTIKYNLRDIQIFHTDYTEEKTMPKFY
jgi:putative transposase